MLLNIIREYTVSIAYQRRISIVYISYNNKKNDNIKKKIGEYWRDFVSMRVVNLIKILHKLNMILSDYWDFNAEG